MERLDEVVVGAGAQAADLLLDLALGGEHDDRDVAGAALLGPDLGRDLVAVELGQHDVEQDQVGRLGAPQAESLRAIGRDDDVVALLLERVLQESLDVRVVIDDEDLGRHQSSTELAGWSMSAGSGSTGDDSPGSPIIGTVSAATYCTFADHGEGSKTSRLHVSSRSATAATSAASTNEPVSLSVSRMATGRPAASAT